MKQLIIMSLEPIESRYTKQWFTHLPKIFKQKLGEEFEVIQIDGWTKSGEVTKGAFLDFEATNQWKSEQAIQFFSLMKSGQVHDDAIVLFTDAWNPCAIQLKYTKDLCNKNWNLIGIWHAGSYDPNDFLGRIKDRNWSLNFEASLYWAYDINWFATNFHMNLFKSEISFIERGSRAVQSGFPMEYISEIKFPKIPKENLIVFPARMSQEKQPEILKELEKMLPEYKFVFCCEENMNKKQYHETLAKAKVMISVSLQETLGITQMEGLFANCISLVPRRLSYIEMYNSEAQIICPYPSEWSEDKETANYEKLAEIIKYSIENYDEIIKRDLLLVRNYMYENYFKCDKMIDIIKNLS